MGEITVTRTPLPGVLLVKPQHFIDSRGFFVESYNKKDFQDAGIIDEFVQDNHSKSQKGVLRGLHFQYPHAQGKLVRVLKGSVFDAVIDIRVGSPSYGLIFTITLDENNPAMLYIPAGFAHGFLALKDDTEIIYKVTDYYYPPGDAGIIWNDPDLNIPWPLNEINMREPVLSEKDTKHPKLSEFRSPFTYK